MKINAIIKQILKDTKQRPSTIANAEGISPQLVNYRLSRDNMTVESAIQMLSGCGYKLVAIPKGSPVPKNGYEIGVD